MVVALCTARGDPYGLGNRVFDDSRKTVQRLGRFYGHAELQDPGARLFDCKDGEPLCLWCRELREAGGAQQDIQLRDDFTVCFLPLVCTSTP